jgi:hemerythrin-like domain-containing protein
MIQLINGKLDNDFDNPLGLLSDCHRRIERFLEQLLHVTATAHGRALNPQQREALTTALRYFRRATPLHTADEESSLFTRMREAAETGQPNAQTALAVVQRLEADHDAADVRHEVVDALGARWLEQGTLSASEVTQLEEELRALSSFYAAHIAVEDGELFPLAGNVLSADIIELIGREMAARRGLNFDKLPAAARCAARRE